MIVVVRRIGVPALVALAMGAGTGRAQETFDINIVNNGKPIADVEVILLANDGKTTVGTTAVDGSVTVDMNLANVGKGTRVDVYEIECDDQVVVVLVAQGEQQAFEEECERRRAENNACECRRIGFFIWGDGNVTIDVGANTVTTTPFEPATTAARPSPEIGWADLFTLGATIGTSYWPEFENTASGAPGATATDATSFSPTVGAHVEWGIPRTGLRVGLAAHYSRLESDATFGNQPQTGEIDYYDVGLYGRWELGDDESRTSPYLTGGGYYSRNEGDFESGGMTEHRDHDTFRGNVGGGVVHWFTPKVGFWGEATWSPPAGDNDADQHVRIQVGASVRPMWDACGGSCIR